MSVLELLDKLITGKDLSSNSLSRFQLADVEMSLTWKKQSYYLLEKAKTEDEMKKAVLWCGKNGHALRGLAKKELENISQKLGSSLFGKDHSGIVFGCDLVEEIVKSDKKVYSWISKICHILNPIDNPIIYDSKTRRYFHVFSKADWDSQASAFKNTYHSDFERLKREDAYTIDSVIWACGGDREKCLEMMPLILNMLRNG